MITREFGRHTFLARGAHRPKSPFLGAIDLLNVVEARVRVLEGRGLQALYRVRVLQGNQPFRGDRVRRGLALHMLDLTRLALPEGRSDPELFDILRAALALSGLARRASLPTIVTALKLRMLRCLGLLPALDVCPRTGRALPQTGKVGFSPAKGGFTIRAEGARPVSAELPRLGARLVALSGRELATEQAPPRLVRALHGTVHEMLHWHMADRPRVTLPEGLFAGASGPRRIEA